MQPTSTYTSLTYHIIFSTKYRKPRIDAALRDDLFAYIGGMIRGEKGHLIEIGGTPDHVHILAGFRPTIAARGDAATHQRKFVEMDKQREETASKI